jgi:hypothetical protein
MLRDDVEPFGEVWEDWLLYYVGGTGRDRPSSGVRPVYRQSAQMP